MLLNCHSYYSFCYGTSSIEELIQDAETKGYQSLVLSDINNTSAILEALRLSEKKAFKVIPGIDFRNGVKQVYIGIAKNNLGFQELNVHLTKHLHAKTDFEIQAPDFKNVFVVYPLSTYTGEDLQEHEFIGISAKELNNLRFSPFKHLTAKMVVLQTATFIEKKHFNAHRLLRAIDKNVLLSKLSVDEQSSIEAIAPTSEALYQSFSTHPEIIQNTEHILNTCSVQFEFNKLANKNLKHFTESVAEDIALLRKLAEAGLKDRYPNPSQVVLDRLEKELDVIHQKNFSSYFLINWDITQYAKRKGYFYVGRGSGANSIVAYLLRITDVDPIDLDLYFERFINVHRANAPDFDIDFSWTDRDDITAYIFDTYGKKGGAALLATYSTFQHDAVTRELGKVFGLPAEEIDKLQHLRFPEETNDPMAKLVLKYSQLIAGFPSHLSIHSSGILISELPITAYSATFMPPKGYPTTQFSMLEAEDIGLFKFDILSQRGLGKIKDAVEIVKQNKNISIDIHDIKKFKEDEEIKKLLIVGKCIGCFYVESPAMRMLLAKLRADDYLRLVAASSIIRPGVAKSGMMREYIVRYRNEAARRKAEAELPELYDILRETYGVMVYQEDVIKIAHVFAGLSLADADYLRRGMSWKFKQRNEFNVVKNNFFKNCLAKNYALSTIENIWIQIESFANFAFSKGHSASYAVESYQALYLKAYHPLEYMVATLNNGGGFYRKELYIHEARLLGATIVAPNINKSRFFCEIEGSVIYIGFNMIAELEEKVVERILEERDANGAFTDLYNFVKRTSISIEQLRLLIRVGAFPFLSKNKKELLWEAHMLINPNKVQKQKDELFDLEPHKYTLPQLENSWLDDAFDEIELLGFSLCSPFKLLKDPISTEFKSSDLKLNVGKTVEITGYLVTTKYTRTSRGERMYFGTFIDLDGYWIDTVHFPPSARMYPFSGPGCYRLKGKVVNEFDFIYIEINEQYRLSMLNREDDPSLSRATKIPMYQTH
jgi:DNA polymerase III subunit alpha